MKSKLTCQEVLEKKKDFYDQRLPYDGMAAVDTHLETCIDCSKAYDEYEQTLMADKPEKEHPDFSKFETILTVRMIGKIIKFGVLVIVVWYAIMGVIVPAIFSNRDFAIREKAEIALHDLVDFTMPTYRTGSSNSRMGLWNTSINLELKRTVLHDTSPAGSLDVAVPLYLGETDIRDLRPEDTVISGNMNLLPSLSYMNTQTGIAPEKFKKLSAFREGTCTQFSVSFNRPVTPSELDSLIQRLGIQDMSNDINNWAAVYTGINDVISLWPEQYGDIWGFPLIYFNHTPVPLKQAHGLTYSSSGAGINSDTMCRQSADNFKTEMQQFAEYSALLDKPALTAETQRINAWIDTNGVTLYGAVLTAPTGNIEALRDVDYISDLEIIKVDFDY